MFCRAEESIYTYGFTDNFCYLLEITCLKENSHCFKHERSFFDIIIGNSDMCSDSKDVTMAQYISQFLYSTDFVLSPQQPKFKVSQVQVLFAGVYICISLTVIRKCDYPWVNHYD